MKNLNTKSDFNALRNDICSALSAVEAKYDISFSCGTIKQTGVDFTFALKAIDADEEKVADSERNKFYSMCRRYGFEPEDYYKFINYNGRTLAFFGFNPKARKNYCGLRDINDGKLYYTTPGYVRANLSY